MDRSVDRPMPGYRPKDVIIQETPVNRCPQFTLIVTEKNNGFHIQEIFRSIDGQTIAAEQLEIIIVRDGPTDSTTGVDSDWKFDSQFGVQILSRNFGQLIAGRNRAIERARGKWLTFLDSDAVLDKDYFSALSEFIRRDKHESASMLSSRSIVFLEDLGITVDNHPLGWRFRSGDRLVSLNLEPHVVDVVAHGTTVRASALLQSHMKYSELAGTAFGGADFIGRYLSHFADPVVGLVATARYYDRKRSVGEGVEDLFRQAPNALIRESVIGHLGMARYVKKQLGYVPVWTQNIILYNLHWYFKADRSWKNPFSGIGQDVLDETWETLGKIFEYIDATTIRSFSLVNFGWYLSEGLLRQFKNEAWSASNKSVVYEWGESGQKNSTQKFVYSYAGNLPKEKFYVNGLRVIPKNIKSIRHDLFRHHLMNERLVELPAGGHVGIRLNGKRAMLTKVPKYNLSPEFNKNVPEALQLDKEIRMKRTRDYALVRSMRGSGWIRRGLSSVTTLRAKGSEEAWVNHISVSRAKLRILARSARRLKSDYVNAWETTANRRTVKRALSKKNSAIYDDAWIFIDRPERADDNAEHLYRFVSENHPEINAWFMILPDSADWSRLTEEGFRLIPYGQNEAISVSLKARFILSSHMNTDVYEPIDVNKYGGIKAARVFLQHGMTMNDISKWINTKELAMFMASSPSELESIVGDETQYRLMRNQVELTGFPRHDRLIELANVSPITERRIMMLVPTWRKELSESLQLAKTDDARREIILGSEFYQGWYQLLTNADFLSWTQRSNLKLIFMLHDLLSEHCGLFEFNEMVEVKSYSEVSTQRMLTSAKVVITDYSSVGIDAAIAGAGVFYYQFDSETIYDGTHSFNRSWFSYTDDGVGPVSTGVDEIVQELQNFATQGWKVPDIYVERLKTLIPDLDGMASARVFEAVKKYDR